VSSRGPSSRNRGRAAGREHAATSFSSRCPDSGLNGGHPWGLSAMNEGLIRNRCSRRKPGLSRHARQHPAAGARILQPGGVRGPGGRGWRLTLDAFWGRQAPVSCCTGSSPFQTRGSDWSNPPLPCCCFEGHHQLAYNCLESPPQGPQGREGRLLDLGSAKPGDTRPLHHTRAACPCLQGPANALLELGHRQRRSWPFLHCRMVPEAAIAMAGLRRSVRPIRWIWWFSARSPA